MKKIIVAFDIDGTLRCNCKDNCRDANEPVVELARWLKKYAKNVTLVAWSGGGKEYAESIIRDIKLEDVFSPTRTYSKIYCPFKPDIAIDDIQDFAMGVVNIIIRMK